MKNNQSLENEYRSSQLYKTLKGSGIPAADQIAQGLGKAAQGLDAALDTASAAMNRKAPPQAPQPTTAFRGNKHPYQYTYSAGPQTRPPQNQQPQPPRQTGPRTAQTARKPAGVNPAPAPKMPPMKVVRRGSPMKFYLTGAAAVFYAWFFPMYTIPHYLVFLLVLIGVFSLSSQIFRGKKEFVPIEPEKPKEEPKPQPEKKEEKKPSRTGDPEVDKLIDEGNEYLKKLRAANDAIPEETLTEDISRMERASADIFRYIADHPGKAPQIRKFMSYYLPTTLKLLNSYQRLSAQSVKGENITSTMFNIAGMMHTVADAFEKQLDSLFTDEAMDISADISVFETLLKQEGFVGGNGEKTETKN